jgi:hypothetical protein
VRARSAHSSSFMARKPPMFERPSFLAENVHPSASWNISWAICFGWRSDWPGSRSFTK